MPAAYDSYDYPNYWKNRDYEHQSEVLAIKKLLTKIPELNKILEIGAGFGRLLTTYKFRAKKVFLTDPSAKLISKAMRKYRRLNGIEFVQSSLQNLENKKGLSNFDLVLMVRVLHHIEDIDQAFTIINKLLCKRGYFILEFPNKNNLKASIRNIIHGDITYPISIFPIDIRSKYNKRKGTLPFMNYHPDQILGKLKDNNFEIIEIRSVSNIRSTFLKKLIPLHTLIDLEKLFQLPFAKVYFGPSFFVLARKKG
jgi:ubiquinone/menaquinone biosynthesis C-methylase UbiE